MKRLGSSNRRDNRVSTNERRREAGEWRRAEEEERRSWRKGSGRVGEKREGTEGVERKSSGR